MICLLSGECQLSKYDPRVPDVCQPEEPAGSVFEGFDYGDVTNGYLYKQPYHYEELS